MGATVSEYKGRPVLNIETDRDWNFSFGVEKAALILENINEIVAFVEEHGNDSQRTTIDTCLEKVSEMIE